MAIGSIMLIARGDHLTFQILIAIEREKTTEQQPDDQGWR